MGRARGTARGWQTRASATAPVLPGARRAPQGPSAATSSETKCPEEPKGASTRLGHQLWGSPLTPAPPGGLLGAGYGSSCQQGSPPGHSHPDAAPSPAAAASVSVVQNSQGRGQEVTAAASTGLTRQECSASQPHGCNQHLWARARHQARAEKPRSIWALHSNQESGSTKNIPQAPSLLCPRPFHLCRVLGCSR